MFASELVITAASSVMTLPPTPTQDSLLDAGVADVALSAFVAPSAVSCLVIILHYLASAHIPIDIYLPKDSWTAPFLWSADLVQDKQPFCLLFAKDRWNVSVQRIDRIAIQCLLHQLILNESWKRFLFPALFDIAIFYILWVFHRWSKQKWTIGNLCQPSPRYNAFCLSASNLSFIVTTRKPLSTTFTIWQNKSSANSPR